MKKKVLVTGINGFVGHHLTNDLVARNYEVIGVGLEESPSELIAGKLLKYYSMDISKVWEIYDEIDAIYHLAGLSAVGPSYDYPQRYIHINSDIVTNMCEHYLDNENRPKILIISSGTVYDSNSSLPINEEVKVNFNSPYAVSKILVENISQYYFSRGIDITIARPFNHIGPHQKLGFIVADLADKIFNSPKNGIIRVGNLTTARDYTDVRDVVRAYISLVESDKTSGEIFNVCSSCTHSGTEIFLLLKKYLDREDVDFDVDENLIRPNDVMKVIGDHQKITNLTGWEPNFSFEQTIFDIVNTIKS